MRADAARNREALVTAAAAAFAAHGAAASLDEVARAAGVGPGTLYRHFPTRDHLILAVIDQGLTDLIALGDRLLADGDAVGALREWLLAHTAQMSHFDGMVGTLVDPPAEDEHSQTCLRAHQSGHDLVRRAVADGLLRADVDPTDVLDMAAGIAWLSARPGRPAGQRERLVALLVDGLARRAGG